MHVDGERDAAETDQGEPKFLFLHRSTPGPAVTPGSILARYFSAVAEAFGIRYEDASFRTIRLHTRCRTRKGASGDFWSATKRSTRMIVLIDNYDSFTFNLVHYLGELGAEVCVHRNDKITSADVIGADPDAIVLSPGPCTPNEAGICLDLIAKAAGNSPDPRRLPRPSGDRPGVRRPGGARAGADARQAVRDPPPGRGRLPRHQRSVPGHALPFARGRAREPAGGADRDGARPTTA